MGRGGIGGAVAAADMENSDSTRCFVRDVKRIVIKVGTAVVTGQNGRLAMGRLGALCEQVKELNFQGYEVILVTSGAVGVGRQRLKYRKLINSRLLIQTSAQNSLVLTTSFDATASFADTSPCLQFRRSAEPTAGPRREGLCRRRPEWPNGDLRHAV
ncbi:hypothetical protein ACQ4PT_005944 [Festuca glaucescens]